ncbi:hypothetical protein ACOJUR_03090 [Alicyclobacillus tolerans]|uniref:hypothetical protein n=1 Tax=Alicyclobacillus tolerans TaxID=90970 RepID=UPI003B788145
MEWKAWTGWYQLTGEKVEVNTVIEKIKSLSAIDALRILSIMDVVMELAEDDVGDMELRFLYLLKDGKLLNPQIVNDIRKRSTALFHPQARYALTQMVFKYAILDMDLPHEIPSFEMWENIVTLVLQLSDLIRAKNSDIDGLKSYLIQSMGLHTEENWSSELLRSYEQYVLVAPTVDQDLNNGKGIILDEIAQRAFHTNLRELFANEFALLTYLKNQYDSRQSYDSVPTTAYIGSALLDQNPTLHRLLNHVSFSFEQFKERMQSYSFQQLLWPTRYFKQAPFLNMQNHVYMPLGLRYFIGRMGGGMYYSLIDNVEEHQKRQFQSYVGRIFETWAVSELRKVYVDEQRIEFFDRIVEKKQKRKLPEAISFYPEGNIVWECKTKRLTVSVFEEGDLDNYNHDILEGIGKGIKQTYDVSRQILENELLPDKFINNKCLPVIVTMEPYPMYGILKQEILQIHQQIRPQNAMNPVVLSSFDFSLLCDYAASRNLNIWQTLNTWIKYDASTGYSVSLHEFLITQFGRPILKQKHESMISQLLHDAKTLYGFSNP